MKFLSNLSFDTNCRTILFNYGFYLAILESILNTEVFSAKDRCSGLELLHTILETLETSNHLTQRITQLFPLHIQEKLLKEKTVHEVVDLIDKGYDTLKCMWTSLMRQEVLYILKKETNNIQDQWDKSTKKEDDLSQPRVLWEPIFEQELPVFPEVQESLCIEGVFLNNFNKAPVVDKEVRSFPFNIFKINFSLDQSFDIH